MTIFVTLSYNEVRLGHRRRHASVHLSVCPSVCVSQSGKEKCS